MNRIALKAALAIIAILCLGHTGLAQLVTQIRAPGPGVEPAATAHEAPGLHLSHERNVSLPINLSDGGGFVWELDGFLSVTRGQEYTYSRGMYSRTFERRGTSGQAAIIASGDEIEVGPFQSGQVSIFRRCKVFRDRPGARWLEILVNPTSTPQHITISIDSVYNSQIVATLPSAKEGKTWATVTAFDQNRPGLLHILNSPQSHIAPTLRSQGNQLAMVFDLTIPAQSTAILCLIEMQSHNTEAIQKQAEQIRLRDLLADLSPEVRKLIVNMPLGEGVSDPPLTRSARHDSLVIAGTDVAFGRILNKRFTLDTPYGKLDLPNEQVVGIMSPHPPQVALVLKGGQVVSGKAGEQKLQFALPDVGELAIPFGQFSQAAYGIDKDRPESITDTFPLALLRSGDRLAFAADGFTCQFNAGGATFDLHAADLLEMRLDLPEGRHQVEFLNGSRLTGQVTSDKLSFSLRVNGKAVELPVEQVQRIRFAADGQEPSGGRMELTNGDELYGKLGAETLTLDTGFGKLPIRTENLLSIQPSLATGSVAVRLWDDSLLRGRLVEKSLTVQIGGASVPVTLDRLRSLSFSNASLPPSLTKQVEQSIEQLGDKDYAQRQQAQAELVKLGKAALPLLRKHAQDTDPEKRQRITEIIQAVESGREAPAIEGDGADQIPIDHE